jgi:hypothetical protein
MNCLVRSLTLSIVLLIAGTPAFAQESRVWTSSVNRRQFEGTLIEAGENSITIRRKADNVVFQVKKSDFVAADLAWVREQSSKPASSAGEIVDLSKLIADLPATNGVPAIGVLLVMDGNNTMNHCSFWIAPERKAAVAAFTNCDDKGQPTCSAAIQAVVKNYLE